MDNVNVPIIGLVENMSWFTPEELPDNKYYIFGRDGAKNLSEGLGIPFLGQVPIVQSLRESGDIGQPAILQGNSGISILLEAMVNKFIKEMKNIDKLKSHER
jgi:ATP-binding protein involved in chromosome partitioning